MTPDLHPAPVIRGASLLARVVSVIGLLLTLPGGCLIIFLSFALILTTLTLLFFVWLPLLYRMICQIPYAAEVRRQAWLASASLGAWVIVMLLVDTTGMGRCIA